MDAISVIVIMESAFDSGLLTEIPMQEFILFDNEKYDYIKEAILIRLEIDFEEDEEENLSKFGGK